MTNALQKFGKVVKYVTKSSAKCYTIRITGSYSCAGTEASERWNDKENVPDLARKDKIKEYFTDITTIGRSSDISPKKLEKCTLPHKPMIEVKPMRKFKIPNIPATEPKSIRFPVDVISEVEDTIRGRDCTFSAFVVEAVRVALESLREEDEELDVSEKDIEEK